MKERETLSTLLDEKLKPFVDKLDKASDKLDKVCDNQIALVTELKTLGVIKHTPVLSNSPFATNFTTNQNLPIIVHDFG